jgi:hypothetical protein
MALIPEQQLDPNYKTTLASNSLAVQMNGSLENLKQNVAECWRLFWNNPDATPQQICDKFGKDAYKIFQTSSVIQTAIATLDNTFVPFVPPREFTINQDGTVTISETANPE